MNENRCPKCGWIKHYRCESRHKKMGRCLRHENHTGPHYYANMMLKKEDPRLWKALQDPLSVVHFADKIY